MLSGKWDFSFCLNLNVLKVNPYITGHSWKLIQMLTISVAVDASALKNTATSVHNADSLPPASKQFHKNMVAVKLNSTRIKRSLWKELCLTHNHLEKHRCIISTVTTDVLVLKHQAISIHSANLVIDVSELYFDHVFDYIYISNSYKCAPAISSLCPNFGSA